MFAWKAHSSLLAAANNFDRKHVTFKKRTMKKICGILGFALLSPYAVPRADAEGPLHWTARHVSKAAVETGDTLSNVARTAGRTIYHRTRPVREAFE
jgi:hypothetical protein